ncbi:MAG: tetratricopeptide repeat protein [Bacteroidota bacterium]|nr:tetratricopeptide repeat protein [Bacteroidota bacterium]
MKYLLLLISLVLLPAISLADEVSHQYNQATQFYRDGEYSKAIAIYENIIKNGYAHSDLYYNLANANFKLDNLPASILYYERAKRLSPNDDDISYNLKIANLKVVDKIEPLPRLFIFEWWQALSGLTSLASWSIFSIIALWIGLFCIAAFRITSKSFVRRLSFFSGTFLILFALVTFIFAIQQNKIEHSTSEAIVFAANVAIKSSPDESGTDLFILHEGVKVEILDNVDKWKKIRLADGKVGWIPGEAIEII